ncbi:adenylyltransferase and sulfurtransferase [Quadrisphaera granulorum]|uniref:Adenylyltransferase/sulfurtransferase n=1 Tax=Quadrisphaera granulorum TaxID=317664 RepID=A0A316AFS5_9ACTN|nr:ThiF family adenylyltransferase [Quadrisphaera granulorum]PWJ56209.1 adenylyltransferase/sulfurtransferase [Quadrisphaera granulorum]SZE94843.1 adenylyltransferase and sulfurtransferase [Quadrisphaera granulorum]
MEPLVEPGPPLTAEERQRWSRHLLLPSIGDLGQRRLRAARVGVVGAGGLGSPVLAYLAAAGVGELVLVDDDAVEASNLQRQVLHGAADVGRPKVDSAADALARQAPWTRVIRAPERLTSDNAARLLAGCHLVIDGADNFATRYAVADACEQLGVPEVFGSLLQHDAQVAVLWSTAAGGPGPGYRDLFPDPPPAGSVASCAEAGVLGALCGAVGSVMAVEAVKLLVGAGEPLLGRVLVLDALSMSWRTVHVRASTDQDDDGRGRARAARAAVPPPRAEEEPLPADAEVTPRQLAEALAGGVDVVLVDVRTEAERALGALPGAVAVPLEDAVAGVLPDLPPGRVVVHCRSGARSERAVRALRAAGHGEVAHLRGGLLAWAADVDPTLVVV